MFYSTYLQLNVPRKIVHAKLLWGFLTYIEIMYNLHIIIHRQGVSERAIFGTSYAGSHQANLLLH